MKLLANEPPSPLALFWLHYRGKLQYALFSFCLILLSTLTWRDIELPINFFFISLYFGVLYKPHLISLSVLFILGMIQDGIYGYPLGISSVEFFLLYSIILSCRKYVAAGSITFSWASFLVFSFICFAIHALLLFLTVGQISSVLYILINTILTTAIYPLSLKFLIRLSNKMK